MSGAAREFASALADELVRAAGRAVVGVYLHGSAVLGDWTAGLSDVDVLVVVADGAPSIASEQLATVLAADRECPGVGLEVSVVTAGAAAAPAAPWPFVVHVTTAPADRKTVWGEPAGGDADLILHYAVTRESGWAARGPSPRALIGAIPAAIVLEQLAGELRWAVDHADATYAILNACRALRYREAGALGSKTAGGDWALARDIEPDLVRGALADRRAGRAGSMTGGIADWVRTVAAGLDGPVRRASP